MKLFRRFNDVGVTVLVASHDLALCSSIHGARRVRARGRRSSSDDAERGGERGAATGRVRVMSALARRDTCRTHLVGARPV